MNPHENQAEDCAKEPRNLTESELDALEADGNWFESEFCEIYGEYRSQSRALKGLSPNERKRREQEIDKVYTQKFSKLRLRGLSWLKAHNLDSPDGIDHGVPDEDFIGRPQDYPKWLLRQLPKSHYWPYGNSNRRA